jgi:hypothetical protein
MNVAGQFLLKRLGAPLPLGHRVFEMGNIDWDYINELANRSPNGLSAYSCDLTMKLYDGSNDLRYPKLPAIHELNRHQIRREVNRLNRILDQMGVPQSHKGLIIYGSMSDRDTLYSIVGLRRVSRGNEYWGHGELIFEVMKGLRPSWDWQPTSTISFPIIWGSIQLSQPTLLAGSEAEALLEILRSISRCLVVRGTAKFYPSIEFGFEAAVFTVDYQRRVGLLRPFWFYDFYHISQR